MLTPLQLKKMNEKIKQLAEQAKQYAEDEQNNPLKIYTLDCFNEKFAELIVKECIRECKQEWYDLNAESVADDDSFRDPRATGIRVGQKAGVLKCISRIKEYFGVEE